MGIVPPPIAARDRKLQELGIIFLIVFEVAALIAGAVVLVLVWR